MKLIVPFFILFALIAYIILEYGMDSGDIRMDTQIDIMGVR